MTLRNLVRRLLYGMPMKRLAILLVMAVVLGPIIGCFNNKGLQTTTAPAPQKKSDESGFNPHLGTELVVHQHFEQFYGCDGKKSSEKKSFVHEGYPDLKLNPKLNIQIDRATFTNLSIENAAHAITLSFGANDGLKKFRVFMTPRRDDQPLGRIFGPPLLEVRRGDNRVQYKYESCQKKEKLSDDPKASEECVQWFTEEEGEVIVTVGVTEKTQNPEICRRYANCMAGLAVTHKGCNEL
jgi:hypothetical protein